MLSGEFGRVCSARDAFIADSVYLEFLVRLEASGQIVYVFLVR